MKKWIILILRITVLAGSIIFLVYKVDLPYLFNFVLKSLPLWIFGVLVLLSIIRIWLNGIRWKLANVGDTYQLSDWDYFRYMMISTSFNLVMPGALGGDIVKAAWVGRDLRSNRTINVLSIFFDRLIGMFSIFLLGLISFSFSPFFGLKIKIIIWVIAVVLFVLFILLVWYIKKGSFATLVNKWKPERRILLKVKEVLIIFQDIIIIYLKKPYIVLFTLLISFVIHLSLFITNFLIARFLGIKISFLDISVISCLVWIITAIPLSISGIGIREISFISLLGYYGVSADAATGLSLYGFLVKIIIGLLGLPFVLLAKRKR